MTISILVLLSGKQAQRGKENFLDSFHIPATSISVFFPLNPGPATSLTAHILTLREPGWRGVNERLRHRDGCIGISPVDKRRRDSRCVSRAGRLERVGSAQAPSIRGPVGGGGRGEGVGVALRCSVSLLGGLKQRREMALLQFRDG